MEDTSERPILQYARPMPPVVRRVDDERYAAQGWLAWAGSFLLSFLSFGLGDALILGLGLAAVLFVFSWVSVIRQLSVEGRRTFATWLLVPAIALQAIVLLVAFGFWHFFTYGE